jgi:hypothetical protein
MKKSATSPTNSRNSTAGGVDLFALSQQKRGPNKTLEVASAVAYIESVNKRLRFGMALIPYKTRNFLSESKYESTQLE